jgi:hypothetical protein
MAIAVGDIYQLTVVQACAGQTIETVVHFRERDNTATPAQLRVSAEAFVGLMRPLQSGGLLYDHFILKRMTPIPFDEDIWANGALDHGLEAGAPCNNTLAMVITKRTGVSGKTHRGRMYIGGLPADAINGQVLSAGALIRATTFCAAVLTGFGDVSGGDPHLAIGLYSRAIGGTTPFTLGGWQAVTRMDPQPILGNQRRRRVGVGI